MAASRLLCLIACALILHAANAANYLRVQRVTLAGVSYHEARRVWPQLAEGDALQLVREADNPHDPQAVRVDWQGTTLGYLPREQSGPIAAALDRGTQLSARIAALRDHPNPRERILIDVFAELTQSAPK